MREGGPLAFLRVKKFIECSAIRIIRESNLTRTGVTLISGLIVATRCEQLRALFDRN